MYGTKTANSTRNTAAVVAPNLGSASSARKSTPAPASRLGGSRLRVSAHARTQNPAQTKPTVNDVPDDDGADSDVIILEHSYADSDDDSIPGLEEIETNVGASSSKRTLDTADARPAKSQRTNAYGNRNERVSNPGDTSSYVRSVVKVVVALLQGDPRGQAILDEVAAALFA